MGRGFWTLIVAALVNRMGTMVGPFLALYLLRERRLAPSEVAALLAVGSAMSMLGSFAGGWTADRLGRRPSLIVGLAGNAAALLAIPWAPSSGWLVVVLLLRSFTNDLPRPATNAAIADLVPPDLQRRAFGIYRTAVNLGFATGSLLGGLIAVESYRWLFVIDAATGLAAAALLLVWFPESRPAAARLEPLGASRDAPPPAGGAGPSCAADAARARAAWRFAGFCLVGLVVCSLSSQLDANLPMSLARRAPGQEIERTYGLLLAMNGLLVTLAQLPLSLALERAPIARTMALGAVLYGVGYGLVGLSLDTAPLALAILLVTAGEMLFFPLGSVLTAMLAPAASRGRWFGYLIMAYGAGRLLSPLVGTAVAERWGDHGVWALSPPLGLLAAAGLLLLGRDEPRPDPSAPPSTAAAATPARAAS